MINLLLGLSATAALFSTTVETQVIESTTTQVSIKLEGETLKIMQKI